MSTFKVHGGSASYLQTIISADEAEAHGCPGATHKLTGRYETIYGYIRVVTGNQTRYGVYADFTPWGSEHLGNRPTLRGWVKGA